MDGKQNEFDVEKDMSAADAIYGHYLGYLVETEEILQRATNYATERKGSEGWPTPAHPTPSTP
jgi:hypothetical protein